MTEKIPPQNLDAEQSVLGAMMLEREAIHKVGRFLKPEDFYLDGHRLIYEAILNLDEGGNPIDLITVTDELKQQGALERIGGATYVASLASMVPTAANVEYYAHIVEEKSLLRSMIRISTQIAEMSYEGTENPEKILDEAERLIFDLEGRRTTGTFSSIKEILMAALKQIEMRYQNKGKITGVPTGFTDLDRLLCGLNPSDLVIIAARPAMGKSSFATSIAHNVALKTHVPVALFSLEMSKEQLVQRMLTSEAKVDQQRARSGNLEEGDLARLSQAAGRLAKAPLYIDDSAMISIRQLRSKTRRLQAEKGLGLVIIDYLQLMQGSGRSENRQQEIAEISRSLKGLARELNIPVVALAQLSRSVEQRQDKRPQLSDLRESGSLEQDADVVMFIYRDEYYNPETEKKGRAEIIVAKQRNGPTGVVEMAFLQQYTRFMDLAREEN